MNYDYVENLVRLSKAGDEHSKEKLAEEFRPLIINLSKKTYIHGYDFEDIMNECYSALFKCISLYRTENHRFVAYATTGIKNCINELLRRNLKNNKISGPYTTVLDNYIEETVQADIAEIPDMLCSQYDCQCLKQALHSLSPDELDLIIHLFYKHKTLKSYTDKKGICYSNAVKKKRHILDKLFMNINVYLNSSL